MAIKRIPEITSEEENFGIKPNTIENPDGRPITLNTLRRDSIEPVPVGTVVAKLFRITGYDVDCDGSLMARLENIDCGGESTGWTQHHMGIYDDSTWVVDDADDIDKMAEGEAPRGKNLGRLRK